MNDMIGQPLAVGDYVCDDRGLVYRIERTAKTFTDNNLASAVSVHYTRLARVPVIERAGPRFVRLYMVLKCEVSIPREKLKHLWQEAREQHVAPAKREELKLRRLKVDKALGKDRGQGWQGVAQ